MLLGNSHGAYRQEMATDRPRLLWHWPCRVERYGRLGEREVFENKIQRKRADTKKLVYYLRFYKGTAVIYENRLGQQ